MRTHKNSRIYETTVDNILIEKTWLAKALISFRSFLSLAPSLTAYVAIPNPAINRKYDTKELDQLYFPSSPTLNTLDTYGNVIIGNIIFKTLRSPFKNAFFPNDLVFTFYFSRLRIKLPTYKSELVPWKFNSLTNKKAQGLCSLNIIKSTKTSSISNERLVLCLVYHHSIPKTNLKLPVLLKSSSRTTSYGVSPQMWTPQIQRNLTLVDPFIHLQ